MDNKYWHILKTKKDKKNLNYLLRKYRKNESTPKCTPKQVEHSYKYVNIQLKSVV